MSNVLLVAATDDELCGHEGLACGIGPVEAAITTARELSQRSPRAVLNIGIAGARGVTPGGLVIGSEAVYCDISAEIFVIERVEPDSGLLTSLREAIPEALVLPIGTSATVGGSTASYAPQHARRGDGRVRRPARVRGCRRPRDRGAGDLERDLRGRPFAMADRARARGDIGRASATHRRSRIVSGGLSGKSVAHSPARTEQA